MFLKTEQLLFDVKVFMGSLMNQKLPVSTILDNYKRNVGSYNNYYE